MGKRQSFAASGAALIHAMQGGQSLPLQTCV